MKTINDYKYSQRAVAPIIATLLMVAISVVGGILIFVFAQGFFTDTNIGTPHIESMEIFGYDARDVAGLRPHNFVSADSNTMTGITGATVANSLGAADHIAVYIRNKGAGPITIETVKLYGTGYTFDNAAIPAAGEFAITILGNPGTAAAAPTISAIRVLEAGQEATLIISYDSATNGKIKIGRPLPVVIVTGNGAVFTKQLQNGVQLGS